MEVLSLVGFRTHSSYFIFSLSSEIYSEFGKYPCICYFDFQKVLSVFRG